ncbi:MAG TPA: mandelate racemase, partial [Polyangia bacterium]
MDAPVTRVDARAFVIPTEEPESDGTLEWDHTTLILVEVEAGGVRGLGYTYADASCVELIARVLAPCIRGRDPFATGAAWDAMLHAVRNVGRAGAGMMAISAVDVALWDLKARLLGVSLGALLPRVRDTVPIYGSGGFTSYDEARLCEQLAAWVGAGIPRVKMKV